MSNDFSLSTQFKLSTVTIDGIEVAGLFKQISLYENIFRPVITGSIVMSDSDGASFIQKNQIEGNEDFAFTATNANGQELNFSGVLNGQRNKVQDGANVLYTFDFTTQQVEKNEGSFVTKRFNEEKPEDVVSEMLKRIEGGEHSQMDRMQAKGEPISFVGGRRRPTDVIGYVLKHGVMTSGSPAQVTDNKKEQLEQSSGSTGALFWQTIDGYRYVAIDDLLAGQGGNAAGTFTHQLQNKGDSLSTLMNTVITYDFEEMGDMQTKMRSGAFRSVNISFDLDKGLYKEVEYNGEDKMTEKQKKRVNKPTRYIMRPFTNERFQQDCTRAQPDQWDKTRKTLQQGEARQNTFSDQKGTFVLPPNFTIRAGDSIEIKIPRVESEFGGGYNEKHSGKYIVKQVGHHLLSDGRGYTKVKTIRSTTQQDDASSQQ
ncbi:baseplate central spike [Synechococcus phage S-CREM2]|nr:baseplate central spike [Synechococcus phage S-CREM2]